MHGRLAAKFALAIVTSLSLFAGTLMAQQVDRGKYSEEVVAKANKVLEAAGMRRSGKSIQSVGLPEISRAISGLTREKRELRLLHQDWKRVVDQLSSLRSELQRLNVQHGELSLQLARVAGVDVAANNRIVGLMNAVAAKMKTLAAQRPGLKQQMEAKRKILSEAEAKYAETVLAIRREFDAARDKLAESLKEEDVQIALRVMHANFASPQQPTSSQILSVLDKRIERIEQEIFSESVPMDVKGNSVYVDVVVGNKTTQMVVDSGAEMICLPTRTANELGISVSVDAREMQLMLADGRAIPARGVTLPRVRVGEFEVENVDAAILDPVAGNAEPLLGMSFLGNFKFEIDKGNQSLTLLRVDAK